MSRSDRKGVDKLTIRMILQSGHFSFVIWISKRGDRYYISLPEDYVELWEYLREKRVKISVFLEWKLEEN